MGKLAEVVGGIILAFGGAVGLYRMLMAWARGVDAKRSNKVKRK